MTRKTWAKTRAKTWAFEDFSEGKTIDLGCKSVTAAEIVEFAREFDPQPFHLDEEAGRASILGGLSASGWHVCAMVMRLLCDAFVLNSTSQGAPGVKHVRWRRPVLAGDRLTGRATVTAARVSGSRPSIGLVTFRIELFGQTGEAGQPGEHVFEMETTVMFLRRGAAS